MPVAADTFKESIRPADVCEIIAACFAFLQLPKFPFFVILLTMSVITAQNNEITANSPVLTAREQEVLDLLLAGSVPKEVANALNISHSTVLDHKKNIYSKLDVHSANELFAKYSKELQTANSAGVVEKKSFKKILKHQKIFIPVGIIVVVLIILISFILIPMGKGTSIVITRWDAFNDELGSSLTLTQGIENIQDKYTETYTISGNMLSKNATYAGVIGFPDFSMNKAMCKAKRFSFTVLGDGKEYTVMLPTKETRVEGGLNHYGKQFTTENGVISTFVFNIDELYQSPYFGKKVPFVNDSIEAFQIQVYSKSDFNLKFWDIQFF